MREVEGAFFRSSLRRLYALVCLVITLTHLLPAPTFATPPSWQTSATSSSFYRPPYPLAFVASWRDWNSAKGGEIGTDVLGMAFPDKGSELWYLRPDGTTVKLFPYASTHQMLVDFPIGGGNGPINGVVTEPSISIDGNYVYFSYFHDALNRPNASSEFGLSSNADLFVIDLRPIKNNPSTNPELLPVARLTSTIDKHSKATNSAASASTGSSGERMVGIHYLGPVEMDTAYGRKLVFVSNLRRNLNSNAQMSHHNYNFNLFTADLSNTSWPPTISNINQFQYYTTTSVASPGRLRNGIFSSYQSSTEDARKWEIQSSDSEGKWAPLLGYGEASQLLHLGTFCVKSQASPSLPAGDYFFGLRYYNLNENGFGTVVGLPMSKQGINDFQSTYSGTKAVQSGQYNLTIVQQSGSDQPSSNGKFSTPECGRPDEIYLSYSPSVSNHRDAPEPQRYPSKIVYKSNLESANPLTAGAFLPVIESTSNEWRAIWPKPVIDWNERLTGIPHPSGLASQQFSDTLVAGDTSILAGQPFAYVGTSALFNTDITTPDCRLPNGRYFKIRETNTGVNDTVYINSDGLTRVKDTSPGTIANQQGVCAPPIAQDILGVAIYETSNKSNLSGNRQVNDQYNPAGYNTNGKDGGALEAKRLLGVYSVQNQADTSFKAKIPANIPFEFNLLESTFGLKYADVRSWHSLRPREFRRDCGGCHNHREGQGIDWNGTIASNPNLPALDTTSQTTYIDYQIGCVPEIKVAQSPTLKPVEWSEISAKFHQNCGGCHASSSSNQAAKSIFVYDANNLNGTVPVDYYGNPTQAGPHDPVTAMTVRRLVSSSAGALSSPIFWAAIGARTDGRDNNRAEYQPNPALCSEGDFGKCGFHFSSLHSAIGSRGLGLCHEDLGNASWVYKLGQWIDNHMPRNRVGASQFTYQDDWFHPTIDGALTSPTCQTNELRIGYWDDTGYLQEVSVTSDGQNLFSQAGSIQNGTTLIDISNLALDKVLTVTAKDAKGNQNSYSKTLQTLVTACELAQGRSGSGTGPSPEPTPTPASQPSTLNITVEPSGILARAGLLKFQIETNSNATAQLICSAKQSPQWCVNGTSTCLNLSADRLAIMTSQATRFKVNLSTTVGGKIKVGLPKSSKYFGKNIYCQLIGYSEDLGKSATSNMLKLKVPNKPKSKKAKSFKVSKSDLIRGKILYSDNRSWEKLSKSKKAKIIKNTNTKIAVQFIRHR